MSYKIYKKENHLGMFGKKHTEESKEKNRLVHLGKKQNEETIEKRRKKLLYL